MKNHQPGLSPAHAADRVAGWWGEALRAGLSLREPVAVELAYYAHHLHRGTAQGADPELLEPDIQELIVTWSRLCGAQREVAQGRLTAPARAAVHWVADRYGLDHRAARVLATVFFREVHTYFTEPDRRAEAVRDVATAIERARPAVIIAHSLGSVVAYEALWSHPHDPVDLLITLGSPLAMPDIVYHRLTGDGGSRQRPPGVANWINIADPGDIIAVPVGAIPHRFRRVTADLTDAIGAFAFHRVSGYLRCGATAGALAAYLEPPEC